MKGGRFWWTAAQPTAGEASRRPALHLNRAAVPKASWLAQGADRVEPSWPTPSSECEGEALTGMPSPMRERGGQAETSSAGGLSAATKRATAGRARSPSRKRGNHGSAGTSPAAGCTSSISPAAMGAAHTQRGRRLYPIPTATAAATTRRSGATRRKLVDGKGRPRRPRCCCQNGRVIGSSWLKATPGRSASRGPRRGTIDTEKYSAEDPTRAGTSPAVTRPASSPDNTASSWSSAPTTSA